MVAGATPQNDDLVSFCAPPSMSFCASVAQSQNLSMDSAMVAGATPQNDDLVSFCAQSSMSFCASVAQSQNLSMDSAMVAGATPQNDDLVSFCAQSSMSFCASVAQSQNLAFCLFFAILSITNHKGGEVMVDADIYHNKSDRGGVRAATFLLSYPPRQIWAL